MGVGGGAHWQALAQQVKRAQAQLEAKAARRRLMNLAMRRALMSGSARTETPASRASFECFSLCIECGYLAPSTATACPACHKKSLVDVGDDGMHDLIVEIDRKRRLEIPRRFKYGLFACYAVIIFGITSVTIAAEYDLFALESLYYNVLPLAFIVFCAALCACFVAYPLNVLSLRPAARLYRVLRPLQPARWLAPLAAHEPAQRAELTSATGPVHAERGQLLSPLTGEPCVAYRIVGILEARSSLQRQETILDESASASFEVDGNTIEGGTVLVEAPLEKVDPERQVLERFLRQRGIHDIDGELTFSQALVSIGDTVEVSTTKARTLSIVKGPVRIVI